MKVKFIGSGDAFGTDGRFQTCILLESGVGKHLLDCGATSLTALKREHLDPGEIQVILITHLHGDHFGGLPFFVLDGQFSRRTRRLVIAGPPGLTERAERAMEIFFPGSSTVPRKFEIEFVELQQFRTTSLGELKVTPFEVVHASGATPFALRVEVAGKVVVYSGDTEWTEALVEACDGADLFICEAYCHDRTIRYHLDHATLLRNAERLRCRRIVLTHMGPDMLQHAGRSPFDVAHDGLELTL